MITLLFLLISSHYIMPSSSNAQVLLEKIDGWLGGWISEQKTISYEVFLLFLADFSHSILFMHSANNYPSLHFYTVPLLLKLYLLLLMVFFLYQQHCKVSRY